jgi:hypothetical protein
LIACEYGPIASGAFFVKIISFICKPLTESCLSKQKGNDSKSGM